MSGLTSDLLVQPRRSDSDSDSRYPRKVIQGSQLVRNRVSATAMASPPTFSSNTSGTLAKTISRLDTRFRISGALQYTNGVAGVGYPRGAKKTDGTYSPFAGSWRRSFDFDGQAFEFQSVPATDARFRIWVNEQPHAAAPVQLTTVAGTVGGTSTWIKVDFGSRAQRRIMVETLGNNPTPFNGLKCANTDSVLPPSIPSARIAWVGDSITYGTGASSLHLAYSLEASWLLGIDDAWINTAVPSTGLVATSAPYGTFGDRLNEDLVAIAPDVLVVQSSINDTTFQGLVAPAFTAYINAVRAALPSTQIVVLSPIYAATSTASQILIRDEVQAAATALSLPFIDVMNATVPVFFGTGQIGATTGDGNADFYREAGAVKTHPSDAGHDYLARWVAGRIAPMIGQTL